ncbi:MAG TPA: caspase family protein [Deltaproteobacteria bacterium]|nr:caspase family protein [Deltaproteobacteria bacterium]HQB38329.1 caspase family protein [Deltaproteobacteria bacterium]
MTSHLSWAAKTELFVQTGHSESVTSVAVNRSGNLLVSIDKNSVMKIWDMQTGREIRTEKLKYSDKTISFVDESRFAVQYTNQVEIMHVYGGLQETIRFPKIPHMFDTTLGKDRRYLFTGNDLYGGVRIYSMSDGAELMLPEVKVAERLGRCHGHVARLGHGYYGVFYRSQSGSGNVDYVIYDDTLQVRKRGSLSLKSPFYGSFKVSADLKLLAAQSAGDKSMLQIFDLASGRKTFSYQPRPLAKKHAEFLSDERLSYGFLPDGRLMLEYGQWKNNPERSIQLPTSSRLELVLVTLLENGMYSEKKIMLDGLDSQVSTGQSRPYLPLGKHLLITGFSNGDLKIIDMQNNKDIRRFGTRPTSLFYSAKVSNNNLLVYYEEALSSKPYSLTFSLWDLAEARLKMMNVSTRTGTYGKPMSIGDYKYSRACSADPASLYRHFPTELFKKDYKDSEYYGCSQSLIFITKSNYDFSIERGTDRQTLLNRKTKQKLADFYAFEDGEWVIITPDGYYNASANGEKHLNVRVGTNVYGIENYRESFFRPDLVKLTISGGPLQGYRTLADVRQPPKVSIVQTAAASSSETFKLTLKLEEQGGGIGDVRLFLNGTAVLLENARSLKTVEKGTHAPVYRSYNLKLAPGSNTIKAVAFNADNTMQSNAVSHQVQASFAGGKPSLHALVIGIQEFRNPRLQLNYAIADARLFSDTLRTGAAGMFEQVKVTTLTSRDHTSRTNIVKTLQGYQAIKPEDVFILYMASHGTVDEGEYFLVTSNVGALSTQKLKSDALSQQQLKELVANIPSTKKLIVIDTCNAGQLGQAMQSALLTRGMSEDTAMKVLSRAVGSTILSASTSQQEALEGYQGHGLFTWSLVQGMKGRADKGGTGYIRTTDLAAYVEDEVPNLAEKIFKRAQFPTVSISGQGFPLGRIQ